MEKFGNSGGDNDSERLEIGIDVSLSQDGSRTKICDKATEAAVRDSKDFERRYGIILGANQ